MKPKIYIDGKDGTTGLQIYDRLGGREDIELLLIDPAKRKDVAERKKLINEADLVFLCLPDGAAKESVSLIENSTTRVIDASTAHRTNPDWVYGFAELKAGQKEAIVTAKRVANPGCHATGMIAIVAPLVEAGLLPKDALLSCFSLTGYSGGGNGMIAQYEGERRDVALDSGKLYGLTQQHKHLPEVQTLCGLAHPPVFTPIVEPFYKGMATTIPFHMCQLTGEGTLEQVWNTLNNHYQGSTFVTVVPLGTTDAMYANQMAGEDSLTLVVAGNDARFTITSLFDNLGKGASGAAVQNMNLMLGLQ